MHSIAPFLRAAILLLLLFLLHIATGCQTSVSAPQPPIETPLTPTPTPVITATAPPVPTASPTVDARELTNDGIHLFLHDQFKDALPKLQAARTADPKNGDAAFYLFKTYESIEGVKHTKKSPSYKAAKDVVETIPGTPQAEEAEAFAKKVNQAAYDEIHPPTIEEQIKRDEDAAKAAGLHEVVYTVSGDIATADITYQNSTGETEQENGASLPWHEKVFLDDDQIFYCSAQNREDNGYVEVRVTVDGHEIKDENGFGGYAIATAHGRIGRE